MIELNRPRLLKDTSLDMKIPIQTIVATPRGSAQMKSLKILTGIKNWNTLMRWAVCASLREESTPPPFGKDTKEPSNDDLESTGNTPKKLKSGEVVSVNWHIFAGDYSDEIASAFWIRHRQETAKSGAIDPSEYFKRHLQRGLNILEATVKAKGNSIALLEIVLEK
jgi:DNA sulfur modification protein DndE